MFPGSFEHAKRRGRRSEVSAAGRLFDVRGCQKRGLRAEVADRASEGVGGTVHSNGVGARAGCPHFIEKLRGLLQEQLSNLPQQLEVAADALQRNYPIDAGELVHYSIMYRRAAVFHFSERITPSGALGLLGEAASVAASSMVYTIYLVEVDLPQAMGNIRGFVSCRDDATGEDSL